MRLLDRIGTFLQGLKGGHRFAVALIFGSISALGFAPYGFFPCFLLSYAGLVLLLDGAARSARPRHAAALTGWAFGFGQFLFGLYWITHAFTIEADAYGWMIPFVLLILPGGLALFHAAACWGASYLWHGRSASGRWVELLGLAALLGLSEYIRGHILTGFPWNLAAYSWGALPQILQITADIGAYGLSLLTLLLGLSLAVFFRGDAQTSSSQLQCRRQSKILPVLMLGLFSLIWGMGEGRLNTPGAPDLPDIRLRIVQPGIPQAEKFDPRFAARNWQRLLELSSLHLSGQPAPTHIIWPESAIPFLLEDAPPALEQIVELTGEDKMLIAGVTRRYRHEDGSKDYFNSVIFFGPFGRVEGIYDKFHLVPFGEYLPFKTALKGLGLSQLVNAPGSFSAGAGPQTFPISGAPLVGPLICYEVIFPGRVTAEKRPLWLVNVTNDSWFGTGAGPHQHLLIARVRAIEEGLPIIRAAGTGISAIIDPLGRVKARMGLDQKGVLEGVLPAARPATLYARFGDILFATMLTGLIGTSIALTRYRQGRTRSNAVE